MSSSAGSKWIAWSARLAAMLFGSVTGAPSIPIVGAEGVGGALGWRLAALGHEIVHGWQGRPFAYHLRTSPPRN